MKRQTTVLASILLAICLLFCSCSACSGCDKMQRIMDILLEKESTVAESSETSESTEKDDKESTEATSKSASDQETEGGSNSFGIQIGSRHNSGDGSRPSAYFQPHPETGTDLRTGRQHRILDLLGMRQMLFRQGRKKPDRKSGRPGAEGRS